MLPVRTVEILPGVTLRTVHTKKFKSSMLGVTFMEPLAEETASLNALIPQVLRRGTRNHPDMQQLAAALDDLYGGAIEPIVRKKGEVQCIGFWASMMDEAWTLGGEKILGRAVDLLGEIVLSPAGDGHSFVPAYVESEKEKLISNLLSELNDKRQYSMARLRGFMCEGEPYGVGSLGSRKQVAAITPEALYARYRAMLESAPVYLYYCGSAEPSAVEAAFRTAFAPLGNGPRNPIPGTAVVMEPAGPVRRLDEHMDVTQGKLALGFRLGQSYDDCRSVAQATIFNALYGGAVTSKLFMNVREKLSLCYFASSSVALSKGVMFVSSGVEFENFDRAEQEILLQLDACRNGDISAEELESVIRAAVSSYTRVEDAQGGLEEFWLNRFVLGREFSPEDMAAELRQVTIQDVVRVAGMVRTDSIYRLYGKEAEA